MGKTINGSVTEEKKGTLFKSLVANTVLIGDDTDLKKFLYFDWLKVVQFFGKQCRKELIQCKTRQKTKQSNWSN